MYRKLYGPEMGLCPSRPLAPLTPRFSSQPITEQSMGSRFLHPVRSVVDARGRRFHARLIGVVENPEPGVELHPPCLRRNLNGAVVYGWNAPVKRSPSNNGKEPAVFWQKMIGRSAARIAKIVLYSAAKLA